MSLQTQVYQVAPHAEEGSIASTNGAAPIEHTPGLRAAVDVTIGRFVFPASAPEGADNERQVQDWAQVSGTVKPIAFAYRVQNATLPADSSASLVYKAYQPFPAANGGQFWAKTANSTVKGQKAFASYIDGTVAAGDEGGSIASAVGTAYISGTTMTVLSKSAGTFAVGQKVLSDGIAAVKASGTLTFALKPTSGDTVTIGANVYAFKTEAAAINDIPLGSTLADTLTSLVKTINGTGVAGTDYFLGTVTPNPQVSAEVSEGVVTLTALVEGVAGNSIALASSSANAVASGAHLAGGAAAQEIAANTFITALISGTGGTGTYSVSVSQTFGGASAPADVTGTEYVETDWKFTTSADADGLAIIVK